jgi:hypothetical protein
MSASTTDLEPNPETPLTAKNTLDKIVALLTKYAVSIKEVM